MLMTNASTGLAVVTGAARGIGRASALALARRGFDTALVDRLEGELSEAKAAVEACGRRAMPIVTDVSLYDEAQRWGAEIIRQFGRIDVLVNNAGISQPKTLIEISEAEYDQTIAVNLKSQFNWCKAVAPQMLKQGAGRIINISSVSANNGAGPMAVSRFAYCTAKAGVLGLTRGLAKELAPAVTVNAICPGSIHTDLTDRLIRERRDTIVSSIPLQRLGTPEDIAEAVAFLATVTPNFITGEVIDVDGGQFIN